MKTITVLAAVAAVAFSVTPAFACGNPDDAFVKRFGPNWCEASSIASSGGSAAFSANYDVRDLIERNGNADLLARYDEAMASLNN